MRTIRLLSIASPLVAAGLFFPVSGHAQVTATATGGSVTIVQELLREKTGRWTLLQPYQLQHVSSQTEKTIAGWPGSYTMIVEPPEGASATLRLYRGTKQLQTVDRPQMTFTLEAGESLRISIHYTFKRVGEVSISSDPAGIGYTLEGPNKTTITGKTPGAFLSMPVGQYAVTYEQIPGCPLTPIKSLLLEQNARVSFHVKIACSTADTMRERNEEDKEKFVTIVVDNTEVTLFDVPQDAWYATFVFDAAKGGMISGYRDAAGKYTGSFGPENLVTVAELAKMAHRVGGIIESDIGKPSENKHVKGQWFAPYIASAEHRGWTIFADASVDPTRPATRGEVIVTLLQALDVPVRWPKGGIFTDITWRTRFAGAIETAAADGVVSGRTDAQGNPTGLVEPDAPINRAEIAKILVKAADMYRK
ncbi:MAG: Uncharacterized protein G01um101425_505 [Candidatus Peregrinibacteria bacterium Gr01-1014_25]|nr:MAG: Uncharacterized protein G01um101425_505 [Candidatus Peregrinibacteria bacterium Gr01-1014_25]